MTIVFLSFILQACNYAIVNVYLSHYYYYLLLSKRCPYKEEKKKERNRDAALVLEAASLLRSIVSRSPDAEFRVKVSPRVPRESDISLTFVRNPFRFARIFCDHVRGSHRAAISRRSLQKLCGRPLEGGQRGADRDS